MHAVFSKFTYGSSRANSARQLVSYCFTGIWIIHWCALRAMRAARCVIILRSWNFRELNDVRYKWRDYSPGTRHFVSDILTVLVRDTLARRFFLKADENGISSTPVEYVSSNRRNDKFEKWNEFASVATWRQMRANKRSLWKLSRVLRKRTNDSFDYTFYSNMTANLLHLMFSFCISSYRNFYNNVFFYARLFKCSCFSTFSMWLFLQLNWFNENIKLYDLNNFFYV